MRFPCLNRTVNRSVQPVAPKFARNSRSIFNSAGALPEQTEISDPTSLYQLAYMQMQLHSQPFYPGRGFVFRRIAAMVEVIAWALHPCHT